LMWRAQVGLDQQRLEEGRERLRRDGEWRKMERSEEERKAFAEFVEDANRVDVDLAKVVLPNRPGFTLPARPATPSEL